MSIENPLTSDPILEPLTRFSPAPAGLDRDELLFQAGKASAQRIAQPWKALAALLLVTQTLTIGSWFTRSSRPQIVDLAEKVKTPVHSVDSPNQYLAEPSSYASLLHWDGDRLPETMPSKPNHSVPILSVADIGKHHLEY